MWAPLRRGRERDEGGAREREKEGLDRSEGGGCGAVRRRHTFFLGGFRLAACAAGLPADSRLAPLPTLIVTRGGVGWGTR